MKNSCHIHPFLAPDAARKNGALAKVPCILEASFWDILRTGVQQWPPLKRATNLAITASSACWDMAAWGINSLHAI